MSENKINNVSTYNTVSKRLTAYVPDVIFEELEEWAERDGRSLSNLVGFILERAVRDEEKRKLQISKLMDRSYPND